MKEIDISSCPVIGRGGAGTVYRLDEDKIVKVYHPDMKLESVQRERELARAAIVSGIPSVIPYDTVRCGESYGIVFEMIASDTLGHAFANNPDKIEEYVDRYVAFVKELHSVHLKQDSFEDLKTVLHRAVPGLSDCLGVDELDLLNSLIDSIPDGDSLIHGDLHPGNIMVQDDTLLLIDLDSASRGAKVWELAALFRALDQNRLSPKRMQLLMSGQRARLALVETKKLASDGVTISFVPDRRPQTCPECPHGKETAVL